MLQWRQYAPDADLGPTRRVGNIYTRAWAVVHHHEGDSWFLLTLSLTRHSDTQAFPYFHRTGYYVADAKMSYHLISTLIVHGVKDLNLKALKGVSNERLNQSHQSTHMFSRVLCFFCICLPHPKHPTELIERSSCMEFFHVFLSYIYILLS